MKPKIRPASIPVLCEIDRAVQEYGYSGSMLYDAAADVCNGLYIREELSDLIRSGILVIVATGERLDARGHQLCGTTWSVDLTDKAIDTFWPNFRNGARDG